MLVECEPNIAASVAVEFAEAGERHEAPVSDVEPALPVRAICRADVGRGDVRLHPEQRVETNRLALAAQFASSLSPRVIERLFDDGMR